MPNKREQQLDIMSGLYYHCKTRCVKPIYLGDKKQTFEKSFKHHRDWVEKRLQHLAKIFTLDLCGYAIMPNHTHLVLHVGSEQANHLTIREVLLRWGQLYSLPVLAKQYLRGESLCNKQLETIKTSAEVYRKRLYSIDWFIRALNEPLAKLANQKTPKSKLLWQGQFKSKPLKDKAALLACMTYVDLNPIRANYASSIESSDYTSIKSRLVERTQNNDQTSHLASFNCLHQDGFSLPFNFNDYCEIVRLTNAIMQTLRDSKKNQHLLQTSLTSRYFSKLATCFEKCVKSPVTNVDALTFRR